MNYDALDDAELSLVLGFHLLDLNGISEGTKGKQREGEQTDLEVALALQKTELETRLAVANDRSLSQSIVRAVTQDAEAINAFVREEEQADRDRQLALRSRNGVVPAAELVVPQTPPAVVISTLPAAAGSGSARAPRSHLTSTGSPAVKRELPVDQNGATDGDGHGLDVESRPKKKLIKGTGNAVAAPIQPFNSKPAISGNASVKGKKPASGSRNGDGGTGGQAVKTRSSITIRSSETGKIIALDNLDDDEMPEAESSGWAASRRRHEESSAWAASSRQDNIQGSPETTTIDAPLKVCVSCGDAHSVFDTALCPCKHEYCQECLNNLFQTSLKDESLFPPSCCGQQIPVEKLEISEGSIPLGLMERFTAKKLEMDTPDRTYCHKPTCSMFIYAWYIDGDVGTCVGCDEKTCAKCKGAAHDGDCGEVDEATQEVLRLATENGWQRCISCRSLVELVHGCHHMSKPHHSPPVVIPC